MPDRIKSIQCHSIALDQNAPVVFACQNGCTERFDSFEAFHESSIWKSSNADFIASVRDKGDDNESSYAHTLAHDSFRVECPTCNLGASGEGRADEAESHAVGITDDGFQAEAILVSNGPTDQTRWWQIRQHHGRRRAFENRACPECTEPLSNNNFREDGNAPELGWEYYECPECGEKMTPESLDSEVAGC